MTKHHNKTTKFVLQKHFRLLHICHVEIFLCASSGCIKYKRFFHSSNICFSCNWSHTSDCGLLAACCSPRTKDFPGWCHALPDPAINPLPFSHHLSYFTILLFILCHFYTHTLSYSYSYFQAHIHTTLCSVRPRSQPPIFPYSHLLSYFILYHTRCTYICLTDHNIGP